jgi:hypothetical protein
MSKVITPTWTDNVTVLAPYCLDETTSYRTTTGLDLRLKRGGILKLAVACGKSTALTAGSAFHVQVFRTLYADGISPILTPLYDFQQTAVGIALINGAVAAGGVSIAFDGAAGTAFAADNIVCIWGVDAAPAAGAIVPYHGVEWLKISKGAATPILFNEGGPPRQRDHRPGFGLGGVVGGRQSICRGVRQPAQRGG